MTSNSTLTPKQPIQLRSNALESARQVANKHLERELTATEYMFKVLVYPHNVIREHKMATGAGADRISRGMSQAFGRPVSVAARIRQGQPIFVIRTMAATGTSRWRRTRGQHRSSRAPTR